MTEVEKFKQFLEDMKPEDFDRSSAIETGPGYTGPGGFGNFIQRRLVTSEDEFEDEGVEIDPIIYLANADEERTFEGYHDETIRDMFIRINREARQMQATMTFVSMMVPAAKAPLDLNGMDSAEVRAAIDRGDLQYYYGWYAEHQTGDEPDRRGGLWEIVDGRLSERSDGVPEVAPLLHSILA